MKIECQLRHIEQAEAELSQAQPKLGFVLDNVDMVTTVLLGRG